MFLALSLPSSASPKVNVSTLPSPHPPKDFKGCLQGPLPPPRPPMPPCQLTFPPIFPIHSCHFLWPLTPPQFFIFRISTFFWFFSFSSPPHSDTPPRSTLALPYPSFFARTDGTIFSTLFFLGSIQRPPQQSTISYTPVVPDSFLTPRPPTKIVCLLLSLKKIGLTPLTPGLFPPPCRQAVLFLFFFHGPCHFFRPHSPVLCGPAKSFGPPLSPRPPPRLPQSLSAYILFIDRCFFSSDCPISPPSPHVYPPFLPQK